MEKIKINDKWELIVPKHRAERTEWPFWEKERLAALHKNIKKGDLIYDIGTEEGDMSALIAKWSGNVILFEPNDKVWSNVKAIWDANNLPMPLAIYSGFASNLTTINQPANITNWPESANEEVVRDHGFKHLSEEGAIIPQIRLDDFQSNLVDKNIIEHNHRVAILNIDVEGSEYEVLKGAKNILTFHRPLVFVSIHPEQMFWNHKQYMRELYDYMESLNYKMDILAYDHELHVQCTPQ